MAKVIALSGFMGCGKSTVGRLLASRLSRPFVDLDVEVERREGSSIDRIFLERGEEGFRRAEEAALEHVLTRETGSGAIVALGGGTVTWPASASRLASEAFVVFVSVTAERLWERVRHSQGRPLASSRDAFLSLADARARAYLATADAVVEGDLLSPDQTADAIAELVRDHETTYAEIDAARE